MSRRPVLIGLTAEGLTRAEIMPFLHGIAENHKELVEVGVVATRFCKGEVPLGDLVMKLRVAGFLPKGFQHGQVQS